MVPVLVFLAVATFVGCLIWGVVVVRLRAATRQPDVSEGDLCQLRQANRISTMAVVVSLVAFVIIGVAFVTL